MAAKLMQRCCRLFGVSSPLCIHTNTMCGRGKMVISRAPSQMPLALLHVPSFTRQTDKLSAQEQVYRTAYERDEMETLIDSASTTEDLLHFRALRPINANQAALIICRLSRLVVEKKLEPGSILVDARFQRLLQIVHSQPSQVWNAALVNLLRSLYLLGLEQNQLRSVEQEVWWRLRRLSLRQLVFLAEHLAHPGGCWLPRDLLSDLLKHLELRWTEIKDTRTVVVLMTKVGAFSSVLMDRLEDKGLELAEQFSSEDIRKIAMALALQNRRSIPLLRAISYHLVQKHFSLSTNVLLDLAFAYGKLNFHQTQVFQKIASDLHPHVAAMSHGDVVRCIKSFALLKWLNLPLFEAFAQYTVDKADRLNPVHLSNVVLAFARLNFQPSCGEAFFSAIHKHLDDALDTLDPYLLVDLVWSLCVLQQVKAAHLQKVLAPEFCARFLGSKSAKEQNYQIKLIHINSTARLECGSYGGPLLPQEALNIKKLQGERKETPLQSGLREVLQSVAGNEAKVHFKVDTVYGWQLDAEMVLNSINQPLPVADFDAPHLLQSEGSKPLPPGARRLAFLRWEFPNFSNRSKDLLGRFAMARRHLQVAGFLLVDVPYYEWLDLKSEWQKAACLRDKMNKAVAEDMAK
ncbi:FAST kinase domain-containing protein 4 [Eublepharis macularius]|uniref:FAST kinase domain-containing protein 4 n=1 Tax=Eublepharis macularius TaxID=481883 RepID=A0AA97L9F8_EUBMA|nr:FAST kinase domain-containing protein 4 [Eublepharis macularius]XP_054847263.1 FAST kinase domain-containing protein 4 [Eublepharis macularius]XP_054847264.1 FAST kinase domain-containing protein 4 [Eublepharis macularius]